MKQPTYLVTNTENKLEIAKSNLCLIRDYEYGWFEVPHSFREEFERKFGIFPTTEHSACSDTITMEEIAVLNSGKIKNYHVKLIMSEEYVIEAGTLEEALEEAKAKFGCDYYIDEVIVTELKEEPCAAKRRGR